MAFEWDDAKSDACLACRSFDFAYAVRAFLDDDRIVGRDRRWNYGEDRYRLLGAVEGRTFVVIYAMRGSVIRIISARKANGREIQEYEQNTRQDGSGRSANLPRGTGRSCDAGRNDREGHRAASTP